MAASAVSKDKAVEVLGPLNLATIIVINPITFIKRKQCDVRRESLYILKKKVTYNFWDFENLWHFQKISWLDFQNHNHFELFWSHTSETGSEEIK